MRISPRGVALAAVAGLSIALAAHGHAEGTQAVEIAPTDPRIRYIGRFDTRLPEGPRCAWSASTVQLRFSGTALDARISEAGNDRLQVVIDGKPTAVLTPNPGTATYHIADGLPAGTHDVLLVKRTEPFVGTTQFLGFQVGAGGKLLELPPPFRRRIEVIGDSISCGYGNEGANQNQHFSQDTENAYLTYGALTARAVGADYVCVAWSGRKMWPDNTIPDIYDRTLPNDPQSIWDAARWVPDVVVINLATNDFGKENPDRAGWTKAYEQFITRLRRRYPKATIYCATGSMMSDSYPPGHQALTTVKGYLDQVVAEEKQAGDDRVRRIDFAPQDGKNGIGSDWHPSVKTHQLMADTLVKKLHDDLGWNATTTR